MTIATNTSGTTSSGVAFGTSAGSIATVVNFPHDHKDRWDLSDTITLVRLRVATVLTLREISSRLGRTHGSVRTKLYLIKKDHGIEVNEELLDALNLVRMEQSGSSLVDWKFVKELID